jgi:hypothetical protein
MRLAGLPKKGQGGGIGDKKKGKGLFVLFRPDGDTVSI